MTTGGQGFCPPRSSSAPHRRPPGPRGGGDRPAGRRLGGRDRAVSRRTSRWRRGGWAPPAGKLAVVGVDAEPPRPSVRLWRWGALKATPGSRSRSVSAPGSSSARRPPSGIPARPGLPVPRRPRHPGTTSVAATRTETGYPITGGYVTASTAITGVAAGGVGVGGGSAGPAISGQGVPARHRPFGRRRGRRGRLARLGPGPRAGRGGGQRQRSWCRAGRARGRAGRTSMPQPRQRWSWRGAERAARFCGSRKGGRVRLQSPRGATGSRRERGNVDLGQELAAAGEPASRDDRGLTRILRTEILRST